MKVNDASVNQGQPISFPPENKGKKESKPTEVRNNGITYAQFKSQIKREWAEAVGPIAAFVKNIFQKIKGEEKTNFFARRQSISEPALEEKIAWVSNKLHPSNEEEELELPEMGSTFELEEPSNEEEKLELPSGGFIEKNQFEVAEEVIIGSKPVGINPDAAKLNEARSAMREVKSLLSTLKESGNKKLRFENIGGEIKFKVAEGKAPVSKETAEKLLSQIKKYFESAFPKGIPINKEHLKTFKELLAELDKTSWLKNFPELREQFEVFKKDIRPLA